MQSIHETDTIGAAKNKKKLDSLSTSYNNEHQGTGNCITAPSVCSIRGSSLLLLPTLINVTVMLVREYRISTSGTVPL